MCKADFATMLKLPHNQSRMHTDPARETSDFFLVVQRADSGDESVQLRLVDERLCGEPVCGPLSFRFVFFFWSALTHQIRVEVLLLRIASLYVSQFMH